MSCLYDDQPMTQERFVKWAQDRDMKTIPSKGGFHVGQKVTYTNDYGVKFKGKTIVGINADDSFYGRCIHLNTDAYWFPHKPEELKPE